MNLELGTVYMIDPNTGKQTPISHINDVEITSEEVTCLGDDVRTFKDSCTLTLNLDALSRFNMARICGITNNKRRYNGLRAIRWRKFK